jgi:acetyltransferase-like isoleucine patch superfamily enzyme
MSLSEEQERLLTDLRALHRELRAGTRERYARINPFAEDLSDWRERGAYWAGEDRGVTLYDSTTVLGDVAIGEHTWVGPLCLLDGTGGLTIGRWCSISTGVQLLTHDTIRRSLTGGVAGPERSPVTVGDRCFIGTHAIVTRGTTVGDGCVIAAGAVVVADVPGGAIVAGVPARRIGTAHVDGNEVHLEYHA